jgi:hypothetical protein
MAAADTMARGQGCAALGQWPRFPRDFGHPDPGAALPLAFMQLPELLRLQNNIPENS